MKRFLTVLICSLLVAFSIGGFCTKLAAQSTYLHGRPLNDSSLRLSLQTFFPFDDSARGECFPSAAHNVFALLPLNADFALTLALPFANFGSDNYCEEGIGNPGFGIRWLLPGGALEQSALALSVEMPLGKDREDLALVGRLANSYDAHKYQARQTTISVEYAYTAVLLPDIDFGAQGGLRWLLAEQSANDVVAAFALSLVYRMSDPGLALIGELASSGSLGNDELGLLEAFDSLLAVGLQWNEWRIRPAVLYEIVLGDKLGGRIPERVGSVLAFRLDWEPGD